MPALSTPENEAGGTPPVDRLPIWKLQRICLGCARGEFDSERRRWGERSAPARRLPAWDRRHPTSPVHSLAVAVQDRIDAEAPVQGGGPSTRRRLLMAYAAFFFDVVVSIFSSRFNASRSLGRCR